jgi:hypothetical protein
MGEQELKHWTKNPKHCRSDRIRQQIDWFLQLSNLKSEVNQLEVGGPEQSKSIWFIVLNFTGSKEENVVCGALDQQIRFQNWDHLTGQLYNDKSLQKELLDTVKSFGLSEAEQIAVNAFLKLLAFGKIAVVY